MRSSEFSPERKVIFMRRGMTWGKPCLQTWQCKLPQNGTFHFGKIRQIGFGAFRRSQSCLERPTGA